MPSMFDLISPRVGLVLAVLAYSAVPALAQNDWFGGGGASQSQQQQAQMSLRLQQLENQMRSLNGQVEQLTFQNRQLQDQIKRMQQDYELRFQDLESGAGARRPATAPTGATPPKRSDIPTPLPADPAPVATAEVAPPVAGAARTGPGVPPQTLGQIPSDSDAIGTVIAGNSPLDLGAIAQGRSAGAPPGVRAPPAAPGVDPRLAAVPAVPSARDEYEAAYNYVLNGEYDLAEASLREFLTNHPTDRRAGAATYWLGESFFARSMHREAAESFLKSYTQYPDDSKAPDSLLKLGLSLNAMGERQAACQTFSELLAKYPRASKALRDRAGQERQRARCA
jgi:tol-pal system protein YbgF